MRRSVGYRNLKRNEHISKRVMNKKRFITIVSFVAICAVVGVLAYNLFGSSAGSKETPQERMISKRNEVNSVLSMNNMRSQNEVVRAIVTLEDSAVADGASVSKYTSKLKSKENKIINSQKSIIRKAQRITGNKVVNQSAFLVNSFSIDAKRSQMKKLAKIEGVKSVSEATRYKTMMNSAVKEGNVLSQWENEKYGYTGEGVVIAVLDTGVNYMHEDMVLDSGVKNKFTKEEWQKKIELLGYGAYMSDKVPFAYNYYTAQNDCISELEYHGYHVSGIASGNGNSIKGVAPNAQIIGLKVLDDAGGGTTDEIVKGIEDAVKLGADVINMSLGKDCAVVSDEDFMQKALENASKEGVICCIAAGNAGTSGGEGNDTNIFGMEDTSMLGTPAIEKSCLAVASADNITYTRTITVEGIVGNEKVTFSAKDVLGHGFQFENIQLVNAGIGVKANGKLAIKAKKLKDKIAVVKSGESSVNAKLYGLVEAGVKGIIYVDEDETIISKDVYDWGGVPVIVVNKENGDVLINKAKSKSQFTTNNVIIGDEETTKLQMSFFTSWGPTNELGIKPEITAPGGNIKAAFDGKDKYSVLSGTSMATPFVAGSEALMLNALKARGIQLKGEEISKFLKNSLMNTADPIVNVDTGNYYSIRQQGSGMVDVHGAIDNNVLATYNGEAKVELGEITGAKNFEIILTNYGAEDAVYNVNDAQIYTDYVVHGEVVEESEDEEIDEDVTLEVENGEEYGIKPVSGSMITFESNTITVPAGKSIKVTANVLLSSAFENNKYVEAFVQFKGQGVQDIGLPVLGFYGDFDAEPIIDMPIYDEGESFVSGKLEGVDSLTSLMEYTNYGELGNMLGTTYERVVPEDGITENKDSKIEAISKARKFAKSSVAKSIMDGTKPEKKRAVSVKVGDKAELILTDENSYGLYKIKENKQVGCKISVSSEVEAVVTVYDKKMNVINSNHFVSFFELKEDLQFSIDKRRVAYVEVVSEAGAIGRFDVLFEEKEYSKKDDIYNIDNVYEDYDDEEYEDDYEYEDEYEEEEAEVTELKLNETSDILMDKYGRYYAMFKTPKEGYYTAYFKTDKFINYSMYEINDNDVESEVDFYCDDSNSGVFLKEFKAKADMTYYLDIFSDLYEMEDVEEMEEKIKVGTVCIKESDGSNYYEEKVVMDKEKVAFSPNNDGVNDRVVPMVTQLRNASEMKVFVLNDKKQKIRTLATIYDTMKMSYSHIQWSEFLEGLINCGTGEYVFWDGTVYDQQTAKYETVKEGIYYIQIEAKRTNNSLPQVVTMPVKIDITEPIISKYEVTQQGEDTIITFSAKDNNALSPYFYIDVCDEDDAETIAKKYIELTPNTAGEYVYNIGNKQGDISLMIEDIAGNTKWVTVKEKDKDKEENKDSQENDGMDEEFDYSMMEEDVYTYELCEGVYLDDKFASDAVIPGGEGFITISGYHKSGYQVSINGNIEEGYGELEDGIIFFDVYIPIEGENTQVDLNFVVNKDGNEVYNNTKTVKLDAKNPKVTVQNNDAFAEGKNYSSDNTALVLLKEGTTYPLTFQVKVEDDNFDDAGFSVWLNDGSSEEFEMGAIFSLDEEYFEEDSELNDIIEYDYNGSGIYTVVIKEEIEECTLSIEATDKTGNSGQQDLRIYKADEVDLFKKMCNLYSLKIVLENESGLVAKDMLNEDGTYTIGGVLGDIPERFTINNREIAIDPSSKAFETKVELKKGCNKICAEMTYNGEICSATLVLYLEEITVKYNKLPKANSQGVINVNKGSFKLSGTINSYINIGEIKINGDSVYSSYDMITAPLGGRLNKSFDYNIKLEKGKNTILFEVRDMFGEIYTESIVVNYK